MGDRQPLCEAQSTSRWDGGVWPASPHLPSTRSFFVCILGMLFTHWVEWFPWHLMRDTKAVDEIDNSPYKKQLSELMQAQERTGHLNWRLRAHYPISHQLFTISTL
uniref:Uncharacterized protein n=1 Tax=Kalanchoe fedtschenkoi TaxID=63787 RepID=A0A7N0T692_KALFE